MNELAKIPPPAPAPRVRYVRPTCERVGEWRTTIAVSIPIQPPAGMLDYLDGGNADDLY